MFLFDSDSFPIIFAKWKVTARRTLDGRTDRRTHLLWKCTIHNSREFGICRSDKAGIKSFSLLSIYSLYTTYLNLFYFIDLALRNLMMDHLQKIIQQDDSGHDSAEDARSCLELMQWKVKADLK